MELTRNQMHHIIMTVIYNELVDFKFGNESFVRDIKEIIEELCEDSFDNVNPYIKDTAIVSLQRYSEIVSAYIPYLKNWKWERLPLLTQSILLMSYTHYYFVERADKKVVINIAVDLAKKYIDDKQAKFINAILDKGVLQ